MKKLRISLWTTILGGLILLAGCPLNSASGNNSPSSPGPSNSGPTDYASNSVAAAIASLPISSTITSFSLQDSNGSTIVSNSSTSGNTASGVLTFNVSLSTTPTRITEWINGVETTLALAGNYASGSAVLNSGDNYVACLIYSGSSANARSIVTRVTSSVATSLLRFELTWAGLGDVDLHADDGSGGHHVYWANKTVNTGGWNVYLDVDNTYGYGPENIRVLAVPSGATIRVFVDYYRGSAPQACTVSVFQGSTLTGTYTHTFSLPGTALSTYASGTSWLVGTFTSPGGTGGNGGSGGSFSYTASTASVNSVVNALYADALSFGATPAANSTSPVAPTPPANSQLDAFLAAAEVDAWGAAAESYEGNTSTAQQLVNLMLTNLQSAYNLSSSLNPQGYPDQTNYPGITYAAIASALSSVGMAP